MHARCSVFGLGRKAGPALNSPSEVTASLRWGFEVIKALKYKTSWANMDGSPLRRYKSVSNLP